MAGVKISQLQDGGALQATDAFPVARGSFTRKILGAQLLDPLQNLDTRLNALSSNTIYVVDSPTIDLSYDSSTRTLRAELVTSSSLATPGIPAGAVMTFPSTIAPTGWLALSGQTLSRSEYSGLWTFAQSSGNIVTDAQWTSLGAYGAFTTGDLSTTFRIPDLRGHFVRGFGTHTDGTAAGALGVKQSDEFRSHTHPGRTASDGAHTHGYSAPKSYQQDTSNSPANGKRATSNGNLTTDSGGAHTHTVTIDSIGGTETRPKNIALLYCIKT